MYVEDPETGEDTDLLYGTLGDYRQPVPAYNPAFPPSIFNFPLELIISDEIQVVIAAPAGLVTHDELITVVERNVETFVRENMAEEMARHNASPAAHPDIRQSLEDLRENLWKYLGAERVFSRRVRVVHPANCRDGNFLTGPHVPQQEQAGGDVRRWQTCPSGQGWRCWGPPPGRLAAAIPSHPLRRTCWAA